MPIASPTTPGNIDRIIETTINIIALDKIGRKNSKKSTLTIDPSFNNVNNDTWWEIIFKK